MTSDGHQLRETWSNALNDALSAFRAHLASGQSSTWRRMPVPSKKSSSDSTKGKSRTSSRPDTRDVSVYRKTTKTGDVYRIVLEIPAADNAIDLEAWRACLATPELRKEWDPAVESAQILEMHDPSTRIVKTNFTLGWPANPRDAVTISRTFNDASTLVDISTSLPRSPDEPSYLRPSPPYVRSHVHLFAWCVQILSPEGRSKRIRITCLWQHDLKTVWNIGVPASIPQQLSTMIIGLPNAVKNRRCMIPALTSYGFGVSIERLGFDSGRTALTVDYSVVPEDQEATHPSSTLHGLDELNVLKEQRRLQRGLVFLLPSRDGWDIRIATRASSKAVAQLPWSTNASKYDSAKVSFHIQHAPLLDDHSVLKVKLIIEFSAALKGVRVNGLVHALEDRIDHDLNAFAASSQLLRDASSAAKVSLDANSASIVTTESEASDSSSQKPPLLRTDSGIGALPRGPAFDKAILSRVRRNYIYFSSLLQEPEAKWKRNSDVRGVSVTQLDSIDPTLVVYKAEATFVGVGLWDLFSTIVTPGARVYWDRLYDDAVLLEDVNELTELWHFKSKPAWPATGRDCVVLKTVYKSPTTIHVFAFSIDDNRLFSTIPSVEVGTIRMQIDLQGWAIESLSPTTTQLTLLEQSDPKGWTGKATVPQQMVAAVAGVGEFAIKHGGPPVVTRLTGARSLSQRYDHDRGLFRMEYEPSASRIPSPTIEGPIRPKHTRQNSLDSIQTLGAGTGMITPQKSENTTSATIECELRCDIDTWTSSLDIVIDPPPQSITCLRRHRLSAGGGGLWLTVGHDISFTSEERLQVIVRRAPLTATKEKGLVMVNGKRIQVDVEELPEAQVKSLAKQKRIKPIRVPLDQPPVVGVIRRRRAELEDGDSSDSSVDSTTSQRKKRDSNSQGPVSSTAPKVPSPLSNFFTTAMEQMTNTTQQAVAALVPPAVPLIDIAFPDGKKPLHFALDALHFAQSYHRGMYRDNWTSISDTGLSIQKRQSPEISPVVPVHRGEKVIEGVTADDVASAVFSYDCRRQWDDRFDSVSILEEYGADCHTAFLVAKTGFPFRDRGFLVSTLLAREDKVTLSEVIPPDSEPIQSLSAAAGAIYCVSASFNPASVPNFSSAKYNSYTLPIGRIYIDAWIIETLDPYTSENYAIPSTRCMRLSAADFAGSVPVAFNSMINTSLPRAILAVELFVKSMTPFPEMRFPSAGLRLANSVIDADAFAWRLERANTESTLLSSRFQLETSDKVFSADILIAFDGSQKSYLSDDGKERDLSQTTPRSRRPTGVSRPDSPEPSVRQRSDSTASLSSSRHRKRDVSSRESGDSLVARSLSQERVRASPSALSVRRDQRKRGPKDFIVAEIIVDLRTYPEGYEVQFLSRLEPKTDLPRPVQLSQIGESKMSSDVLPVMHRAYLLPPSPLYASSSGNDTPTRHLIRLSLPTSQYQMPTVEDPLTGEIRSAPSKPRWYSDLQGREKHASVHVSIRPLPVERRKTNKKMFLINGESVAVGSEKDVHKVGLSDELGAAVLSRAPVSGDKDVFSLPDALTLPLAIEDSLLDPNFTAVESQQASTLGESQGDDSSIRTNEEDDGGVTSESPGQITPAEESPPPESKRGFLSLIDSYQKSLSSFGFRPAPAAGQGGAEYRGSPLRPRPTPLHQTEKPPANKGLVSGHSGMSSSALAVIRSATMPRYSLSTLIALMLIAFLLGSLLRSLLSPADFIYVVTDLGDVPHGVTRNPNGGLGAVEPGWREIKRLVEIKYIVGGWDFQIAVVRRH